MFWHLFCFSVCFFHFHSGRAGDLFIVLQVAEKRGIRREGLNLYSKITIDFTDAILGTVTKVVLNSFVTLMSLGSENLVCMTSFFFFLQVETVEGTMNLRIPPGTQPGDTVKLYRKGVPDTDRPSVRGDHCFEVKVLIPKNLRFVSLSLPLYPSLCHA